MPQISLIICLFLVGCSTPGEITIGDIKAKSGARMGGKTLLMAQKGDTKVVLIDDQEKSFQDFTSFGKWGITGWALTDLGRTAASAITSVKNTKTAAGVSNTAVKEATKGKAIDASVEQSRIAAEAAAIE